MFSVCTKSEDIDSTILKVLLSNDNRYKVIYASGREEIYDFSVHNYNVEIYRMIQQYNRMRNDYVNSVNLLKYKNARKVLINNLISLIGIIFSINLPLNTPLKVLISLLVLVANYISNLKNKTTINVCNNTLLGIEIADSVVENFDNCCIQITDPKTGKEEPWYLITLNELESYMNPDIVYSFAETMDDESVSAYREEVEYNLKKVVGR